MTISDTRSPAVLSRNKDLSRAAPTAFGTIRQALLLPGQTDMIATRPAQATELTPDRSVSTLGAAKQRWCSFLIAATAFPGVVCHLVVRAEAVL